MFNGGHWTMTYGYDVTAFKKYGPTINISIYGHIHKQVLKGCQTVATL